MGTMISQLNRANSTFILTRVLFFSRLLGLSSALNLALFLDPKDEGSRFLLAQIQVHLEMDLEEVHFYLLIMGC